MTAMGKGRQPSVRQLRVGEEIRHCLSTVLGRGDLRDPDLRGQIITVSEVRVSPDLRNATVFVMPLGGEADQAVLEALTRATSYLRSRVSQTVRLRHAPRLSFRRDESYDTASRIDTVLRSPEVARDLGTPKPDVTEN
jgi:ribosome-binding factor A